jgi:capsule polysaccharide export protein KpsE/RkpR
MANAYLQEMKTVSGGLALTESSQRRLFFETRLAKEKDDLANAEVALKQNEEASGLIAPAGQTESEIQSIARVRAEITGRQVQLAALAQGATAQNPDVVRLQSEIQNLQKQLAQMESGTSKDHAHGIPASQVPSLELEYIRKAREVKYHEALFDIIAKQYEAARLDEANSSPILQVLDQATVPDMRSGPPRLVIMLAGFIAGLFGGTILVLYRARRRDTLR